MGVGQVRGSLPLGFAKLWPVVIGARLEARELDDQEGELGLIPAFAPTSDKALKDFAVIADAMLLRVAFALIPNYAANCVGHEWRNQAVVEGIGS